MKKTTIKLLFIAILFSLLIFFGLLIFVLSVSDKNKIEVKYVDNPTVFFTVENCVNKYVGLLASKESEAVYNIIDKKYRDENGITIYNALANNKTLDGNYSFVSEAMLEDLKEKNKYYVRGYLTKEEFGVDFTSSEKIEYGLIIKLDVNNYTFSVILSEVGEYFDAV